MNKATREQQKLVYWLISDYSNFKNFKDVGSTVSEYELYQAKNELKKFYIKYVNYKPSKNSLEDFITMLDNYKDKTLGEDLEIVKMAYIKSIQDFCLNYENFSLALNLMSKEGYRKFIEYLFDFFNEKEIPYRKEIADLLMQNENEFYLYQCLKYKRCCLCGNSGELHHVTNISRFSGYKHETLDLLNEIEYTCLCRKHHSETHSDGRIKAEGIKLNKKMLETILPLYNNQFKQIRKELKELKNE